MICGMTLQDSPWPVSGKSANSPCQLGTKSSKKHPAFVSNRSLRWCWTHANLDQNWSRKKRGNPFDCKIHELQGKKSRFLLIASWSNPFTPSWSLIKPPCLIAKSECPLRQSVFSLHSQRQSHGFTFRHGPDSWCFFPERWRIHSDIHPKWPVSQGISW